MNELPPSGREKNRLSPVPPPRRAEAAVVVGGLVTGCLMPLLMSAFDRLDLRGYFGADFAVNVFRFALCGVPFAWLIARIAAPAGRWRASAMGIATVAAASVAFTASYFAGLALDGLHTPELALMLIAGLAGGCVGSAVMALAAMRLRISPRARWRSLVLTGAALGALLALDAWLDIKNVSALFPVWQASVALIFLRNVRGGSPDPAQRPCAPGGT
jgi:MFS family permease